MGLSSSAAAWIAIGAGCIGLIAVALAAWTWLGRYDLLFSHNTSVVWGAATPT